MKLDLLLKYFLNSALIFKFKQQNRNKIRFLFFVGLPCINTIMRLYISCSLFLQSMHQSSIVFSSIKFYFCSTSFYQLIELHLYTISQILMLKLKLILNFLFNFHNTCFRFIEIKRSAIMNKQRIRK